MEYLIVLAVVTSVFMLVVGFWRLSEGSENGFVVFFVGVVLLCMAITYGNLHAKKPVIGYKSVYIKTDSGEFIEIGKYKTEGEENE